MLTVNQLVKVTFDKFKKLFRGVGGWGGLESFFLRLFRIVLSIVNSGITLHQFTHFSYIIDQKYVIYVCPFYSLFLTAILSSTELDNLFQKAKGFVNLIPAATFFAHPGANNRPVYFSDVIIHKDNR